MATGFAFEIEQIDVQSAYAVLGNREAEYRANFDSQPRSDGLGQFLRAVLDVVSDRRWGATCYWARQVGWLVDLRHGNAWLELALFREEEEWPAATQTQTPVFQARTDDVLDLARIVVSAYTSGRERYGAARCAELWGTRSRKRTSAR